MTKLLVGIVGMTGMALIVDHLLERIQIMFMIVLVPMLFFGFASVSAVGAYEIARGESDEELGIWQVAKTRAGINGWFQRFRDAIAHHVEDLRKEDEAFPAA